MVYKKITCKTPMNNVVKSKYLPYNWDLNVYRGCEHHCQYCFAMYTHKYLDDKNFFNNVYVKENIVVELEKKLKSKSWIGEIINLGGVTDSYQPAEAEFKIMPEIWKLLIKYKTPVVISTKSDLILRDIEYVKELSKITYVSVTATIVTIDEELREKLEPGATPIKRRFLMLKKIKEETNAHTGVHLMPIVPMLTDNKNNLENILAFASKCKIDYIIPGLLNLKGYTKTNFLNFIKQEFPNKYSKFKELYTNGYVEKEYRKEFYKHFTPLLRKYNLSTNYRKDMNKIYDSDFEQLSLFEE